MKKYVPSRIAGQMNLGLLRGESIAMDPDYDHVGISQVDSNNYEKTTRAQRKEDISKIQIMHTIQSDDSNEKLPNSEQVCTQGDHFISSIGFATQHIFSIRDMIQGTRNRFHYSESQKDCHVEYGESDSIRRKVGSRRDSEPTDFQPMWTLSNNFSYVESIYASKRLRAEKNGIHRNTETLQNMKRKVSSLVGKKKMLSSRILVYNDKPIAKSQVLLRKIMRRRTLPVIGSPRINRIRQNRTKLDSVNNMNKNSTLNSKSTAMAQKSQLVAPVSLISSEAKFDNNSSKTHLKLRKINCNESGAGDSHFNSADHVTGVDSLLRGKETTHFVTSLFPNVPPYISFCSHTDKRPPMPSCLHKILKWKLTNVMPKLIRRILINSGFRLLKNTNDWMGIWGKHMKSPCFKTMRCYQKFNHIPGTFKIGRKDSCWRNLHVQILKHGSKEFGFMPKTYIIPQDMKLLRKSWPKYSQRSLKWIVKPPASARGTGIKVINRWSQIPKRKPVIVQRYIERPFLIDGNKFDLRLYVLVTSINPLRVYLYRDGLVRFASVKYSEKSDSLNDRYMHLTNYSINKFSSTYSRNEDVHACKGHKWTISSLWSYLNRRNVNTTKLWISIKNLVLRTLLAGENSINSMVQLNVESKYNCFELFGFDVILDSELVPWLLEVNISPSLHSELPLDLHVKGPLAQAILNTALYNVPPKLSVDNQKCVLSQEILTGPLCYDERMYITYLSRDEKIKHNHFTKRSLGSRDDYLSSILENLTSDDVRCLIIAEDELQRSRPLERIFPGYNTHIYLKYTESPRYYNRLLDAWEHKYYHNRCEGIELLQELCKHRFHLEVPSQPTRKRLGKSSAIVCTITLCIIVVGIFLATYDCGYVRKKRTVKVCEIINYCSAYN